MRSPNRAPFLLQLGFTAAMTVFLTAQASAVERVSGPAAPTGSVWMAVSDRALDRLRGGFDLGSGLVAHFGITRTLYINGDMVTQTTLNLGDLGKLTPAQGALLSAQVSQMGVVQNGPGNVYRPGPGGSAFATVIQNTRDNQHIVNQTVIDASTNAVSMIKGLNIQGTLNDSLARAVGQR